MDTYPRWMPREVASLLSEIRARAGSGSVVAYTRADDTVAVSVRMPDATEAHLRALRYAGFVPDELGRWWAWSGGAVDDDETDDEE